MSSSTATPNMSREFFELVRQIGESRSKSEEDRIIQREIKVLRQKLAEKGGPLTTDNRRKKELLVRLMYVELLGHDASFGYIHAVQLTASQDIMQKRIGYLCCSLFLSPEHDLRMMVVSTIQRDMSSTNFLEVCAGLVAACKLVTRDMVPAFLPKITELLNHAQPIVRKKAVMGLHRCYQLEPESVSHLIQSFRRTLCDKDPSVMGASLCLLQELAQEDPTANKDLVPSLVSILKQILEHRLPKEYDYHRIPAPWIQMKLLKMLAILGENDQRTSEEMYEVIGECLKRANSGLNIGYAIMYECVKTITAIYPNTTLLTSAATAISKFISSETHNLKYLGVTGLAAIVREHPEYAAKHQMVVLDCLEDPDETLKRKTLELLFRITNPSNVETVVTRLLGFLKDASDKFFRADLVDRVTDLAEQYAPSNEWYVRTMTSVFELGGDVVSVEVAHSVMRLLAEGSDDGDDEEADSEMRAEAADILYEHLEKPNLSPVLLNFALWTLGEYGYLKGEEHLPEIANKVQKVIRQDNVTTECRCYGVSALMKITAQLKHLLPNVASVIDTFLFSHSVELQQRCYEFRELARNVEEMVDVLPVDASCEDVEPLTEEVFQELVEEQRSKGAAEYDPPASVQEGVGIDSDDEAEDGQEANGAGSSTALKYDAYDEPTVPNLTHAESQSGITGPNATMQYSETVGGPDSLRRPQGTMSTSGGSDQISTSGLQLKGVKSVWGSQGYTGNLASSIGPPSSGSSSTAAANETSESSFNYDTSGPGDFSSVYRMQQQRELEAYEQKHHQKQQQQQQPHAGTGGGEHENPPSVPSKPAEVTERERLAAALFGGVDSSSSSGGSSSAGNSSAGTGRRNRVRRGGGPGSTQSPSSRNEPVNLLDLSDDEGEGEGGKDDGSRSNMNNDRSTTTGDEDLLSDLDFSGGNQLKAENDSPSGTMTYPEPPATTQPHQQQQQQEQQQQQQQTEDNLMGDLMDLSLGNSSQQQQQQQSSGQSPLGQNSFPPTASASRRPTQLAPVKDMNTQIFGSKWGLHTAEQRFPLLSPSLKSFDDMMNRIQSVSGASLVEAISATQEAIFAGSKLPSGHLVLLHAKKKPGENGADMIVRTNDIQLTKEICTLIQEQLREQ